MKITLLLGLLLLGWHSGVAQPSEIILIRHAEEPTTNSVHLSEKGQQRAAALVNFFRTHPEVIQTGVPMAFFAPRPTKSSSRRSLETLTPSAKAFHTVVQTPVTSSNYKQLAQGLLKSRIYKNKPVVIAWVHGDLAAFAGALGVKPQPPAWNRSAYDRAYILTFPKGKAQLKEIPQKLLPGDSN